MTNLAGRSNAGVIRASPVGQRTWGRTCASARQAATRRGPAARWIAPSTPPPPSSDEFAALTMASTRSVVMSATMTSSRALPIWRAKPLRLTQPR
jgi:hypothetical protein